MPTGSCLYGAITYEYTGEPTQTALCHCNDCQKWFGGGYTSNVIVPRDAFNSPEESQNASPTLGNRE
ncbi:hypothetical protein DL95DRAFT_511939 [Leptodontidium sp. 2 PMI_412]|nr:hypothetical protein DL95DRAFT_511939 [Leptodontidium sp. 2 PMI_412]